jgi:hypothetical protein
VSVAAEGNVSEGGISTAGSRVTVAAAVIATCSIGCVATTEVKVGTRGVVTRRLGVFSVARGLHPISSPAINITHKTTHSFLFILFIVHLIKM